MWSMVFMFFCFLVLLALRVRLTACFEWDHHSQPKYSWCSDACYITMGRNPTARGRSQPKDRGRRIGGIHFLAARRPRRSSRRAPVFVRKIPNARRVAGRRGGSTAVASHGSANDISFHRSGGFRDVRVSFRMRRHTLASKSGSGLGITIQQASSFWRESRVFMVKIVSVQSPSISSRLAFHRGGSCSVPRSRTGPERAETTGYKAGSITGTDVHHDRGG